MADLDPLEMPPAIVPGDNDEERKRRLLTVAQGMPPARPPEAATTPASTPTMPAAVPAANSRSEASSTPLAQPSMPPAGRAEMAGTSPSATGQRIMESMPSAPVGPATQRLEDLQQQGRPELHGWKKVLDVIGQLHPIGRAIEANVPGSPQFYDAAVQRAATQAGLEQKTQEGQQRSQENQQTIEADAAKAQFATPQKRQQYVEDNPGQFEGLSDFEKNDFVLSGKFPQHEPTPPKQANLQQDYAEAVEDAQKRGVDPSTDPKVQQFADAITSLQKQPAAPKDMTAKAGSLNGKPAWAIQTDQGWIDPETRKPVHGFQPQQPAGVASPTDVADLAHGVMSGQLPPDLKEYGYRDRSAISAELKRQGYNLTKGLQDWTATQKYLATLNGSQQTRLRQAVESTKGYLDQVEDIYNQWQQVGATSGWKSFNKASLATAKQLPGESGNLAHRLEARIADLTSDLGTVYKGGNSSTDESLKLAAKNLEGDWNEKTFKDAIEDIRKSIVIRENSLKLPSAGTNTGTYTPNSEASPKDFGPAPQGKADGATGKLPDGTKVIVKGGRLVAQ
jgi:hypothetical protein